MSKEIEEVEFSEDLFDSLVDGSYNPEEEVLSSDDELEEEVEQQEDTDQDIEEEEEEELDEVNDGELDEDLDSDTEVEEEDTLVEADDLDDEDSDIDTEEEVADETTESDEDDTTEVSEDSTETEEKSDGKAPDTETIDYKAFYDAVVNTEFVVNNKKVKGFADPKKIIQAQQMAGGFSEKMAGFKQYRPFMNPLKERGMLEDQSKFDFAMNIIDGDKEAIKQHLKTLNIDPIDLDMDEISYKGTKATASEESIIIEDTLERARSLGVEDKLRQVIGSEWDAESFQEFMSAPDLRRDLVNHIQDGGYDIVQDKIAEIKRIDYDGSFNNMSSVNQYRAAVDEILKQQKAAAPTKQQEVVENTPTKASVKVEKAKIQDSRKEEVYKEKVAKREATIAKQRKRASATSKSRAKSKPKPKFDPMALEGEEFDAHMEYLISGGRG